MNRVYNTKIKNINFTRSKNDIIEPEYTIIKE